MSSNYYDPPQYGRVMPAIEAGVDERTIFIRKTYAHVFGAVLALVGIDTVLFNTVDPEWMTKTMLGGRASWLIVMGAFLAVNWIANYWTRSNASRTLQYAGLGLFVVAEAIIFVPFLFIAIHFFPGQHLVEAAGLITLILFGGLTGIIFFSKADLSYMGKYLAMLGVVSLGLILCSTLFGFNLGIWFSFAMVALLCGYIVYDTSNILHHYSTDSYVAAALALFSSLATLFLYVLRILMQFSGSSRN